MPKIIQLLGPPVILSLALPLAFIASITTTLALCALIFRASIVYFELGFALLQSWILPKTASGASSKRRRSEIVLPSGERVRRSSRAGNGSISGGQTPTRNESFAALGGIGANRDFEGLGGWRVTVDARDDETWISLNSRLELPTLGGPPSAGHRRHRRTLSSQSHVGNITSESFKMSPVTSRARTPQAVDIGQEAAEYFNGEHRESESAAADDLIPMSPEETVAKARMEQRRRSLSAVSNASSGSSSKSGKSLAIA